MMAFQNPLLLVALVPVAALGAWWWRAGPRFALRAVTLALLIVALAGPQISRPGGEGTLWLLFDYSASVAPELDQARGRLEELLGQVGWRVGVIAFADGAQLLRPPAPLPLGSLPYPPLSPWETDLAAGIDLALSLLAPHSGALLVVTDGRVTRGDPWGALLRARDKGVPVWFFPLGASDQVWLEELTGPHRVPEGEVRLEAVVGAAAAGRGQLVLWREGEQVSSQEISLSSGLTRIHLVDRPPGPGSWRYRVEVRSPEGGVRENDVGEWLVMVGAPPPVLLVGPQRSLWDAWLEAAGIPARRVTEFSPQQLAGVELLVWDDVPLAELSREELVAVEEWVVRGGGLVVVLGRRAVAGYFGPAEDLLPVSFTVPQGVQEATVAVVFVLDRSGSMAGRAEGVRKIDLLREAVAQAVEVMRPQDVVGVVAFDRVPHWLIRPAPVGEVEDQLYRVLAGLEPGGGTDLYPAVEEALAALAEVETRVRHILLISDGRTARENYDFTRLYRQVRESGLGLTAVAVGSTPDTEILSGLVESASGELVLVPRMQELPRVLLRKTEQVLRPRFLEGEFAVRPGARAAQVGLEDISLPPLSGYTLTFPKPTANLGLVSGEGDPVFAWWQLGLGRAAAFTCDLRGGWSANWVGHPAAAQLLGKVYALLRRETWPVELTWESAGGELVITVDVEDQGRWVDGLALSGELVGAGGSYPLVFSQVAPGRYQARLPAPPPGAYLALISEPGGRFGGSFPVSVPYPEELSRLGVDWEGLQEMAELARGEVVVDELLPALPRGRGEAVGVARAFLWAAAGLLLVDLLVRKLWPS
jgi:hypothetical protein